jgi:hypothetical protein
MLFWTRACVGVQSRVIANESEPNPSPPADGRRRSQSAAARGVHSRLASKGLGTPPPTKGTRTEHPHTTEPSVAGSPREQAGRAKVVAPRLGFEPKPSGRHRGHRDNYGLGPETTDSLGVVRDSPSLPISEYPADTDSPRSFLDSFWTGSNPKAGHGVTRTPVLRTAAPAVAMVRNTLHRRSCSSAGPALAKGTCRIAADPRHCERRLDRISGHASSARMESVCGRCPRARTANFPCRVPRGTGWCPRSAPR